MRVEHYLERIGYSGAVDTDLATLSGLQQAHMRAVPFENLDIHYGRPVVLDEGLLYAKVVERRRGGFCYELNALFAALLREAGFNASMVSARVSTGNGTWGPEFDHMALVVEAGEPYLVDVGFGDSFEQPLRIRERGAQRQGDWTYSIAETDDGLVVMRQNLVEPPEAPSAQYRFTLQPRNLAEFDAMCRYHQTSPESHFTRKKICSRATAEGRVSLSDLRLIRTAGRQREESQLQSEEDWRQALKMHFGVAL